MTNVTITVNGEDYEMSDESTCKDLLDECGAKPSTDYDLESYENCVTMDGKDHFVAWRPVRHLGDLVDEGRTYRFTYIGPCGTA